MFIQHAAKLSDILNHGRSAEPFTAVTETLGELHGRHITVGDLSTLLESPKREPASVFDAYLALLWKANDPDRSPIGPELAKQLTKEDRDRVAGAYRAKYVPTLVADYRPVTVAVGDSLKRDAEKLEKSLRTINDTFFGPDTKALLQKSWDTSDRIKEIVASLDNFSAAHEALRAFREKEEEQIEQIRKSLGFSTAADEALRAFQEREKEQAEQLRKALEGPNAAEEGLRAFQEQERTQAEQLKKALEAPDAAEEMLRAFHEQEKARAEKWAEALNPKTVDEETFRSFQRSDNERADDEVKRSPKERQAEEDAPDIRFSLPRQQKPVIVEATGTTQPTMHSIASAALQRINDMANVVESATTDLASHRKSTTDQFRMQLRVALIALGASVLLGLWPIIRDTFASNPVDSLIAELRVRDQARANEDRERVRREQALMEELRRMREEDKRRTEALVTELRESRLKSKAGTSKQPNRAPAR